MTAIAARSHTSIGGLYHYFPDKNSVVLALAQQYGLAIEAEWKPLIAQVTDLTPRKFADIFIHPSTIHDFLLDPDKAAAYVESVAAAN